MHSIQELHKIFAAYLYKEAKDWVNVNPDSSMPYVMLSIFVVKMLYMIRARAEVPIPRAVLYRASEIPVASAVASPPPDSPRAENERIIPITVPSRAINVPTDVIVERNTRFF